MYSQCSTFIHVNLPTSTPNSNPNYISNAPNFDPYGDHFIEKQFLPVTLILILTLILTLTLGAATLGGTSIALNSAG